jgi:hypothetical protein
VTPGEIILPGGERRAVPEKPDAPVEPPRKMKLKVTADVQENQLRGLHLEGDPDALAYTLEWLQQMPALEPSPTEGGA